MQSVHNLGVWNMLSGRIAGKRLFVIALLAAAFVLAASSAASAQTSSNINGKTYSHPAKYRSSNVLVFDGIDVSQFQGSINWTKVKASGVDYAFIRCGATLGGYSNLRMISDSRFAANVKAARSAGVNVGVYYFSLATTPAEAKQEAAFAVKKVREMGLPGGTKIVMDYEFLSGSRLNKAYAGWKKLGMTYARTRLTLNAKEFLNYVRVTGYEPVFYSYRAVADGSDRRFFMTASQNRLLNLSEYQFWLAQYSTSNSYPATGGRMEFWQYTSSGSVSGISGRVDRDFMYYNVSAGTGTHSRTNSIRGASASLSKSQIAYTGRPTTNDVTVLYKGTKLRNGRDFKVSHFKNIQKGTAYVIIDGAGQYSNSILKTYRIGTSTVSTSSPSSNSGTASKPSGSTGSSSSVTTPSKPSIPTPSNVANFKVAVNADRAYLYISFNRAANATDYEISYRKNNGSWATARTGGRTTYRLNCRRGDAVAVRVRALNVRSGATAAGNYTGTKYVYVNSAQVSTFPSLGGVMRSTWTPIRDSKGTVSYSIMVITNDKTRDYHATTACSYDRVARWRYRYNIRVMPMLKMGGVTYTGTYDNSCSRTNANYVAVSIRTYQLYGTKGGLRYSFSDRSGITGYQIAISNSRSFGGSGVRYRYLKRSHGMVSFGSGRGRYCVKGRTYLDADGTRYYGPQTPMYTIWTR